MVRITTQGSLYTYKNNLMQSTIGMNNAMMKVMTQRNFNSYSADPAAATRAFKIHSSLNATRTQYENSNTALGKFQTAWDNMESTIDELSKELGFVPALEGLNEANMDALPAQADILRSGAETIINSFNAKYGDDYIFAGTDSDNPPFAIIEENGVSYVTYRGIKVDDDLTEPYPEADPATGAFMVQDTNADGNLLFTDAAGNVVYQDKNGDYKNEDGSDYTGDVDDLEPTMRSMTNGEVLEMWAKDDPHYIDIGMGFELNDDGTVNRDTAFDASLPGIQCLGYGVNEDGTPRNLASIMLRLADSFDSYDPDNSGNWPEREEAEKLLNAFNASHDAMIDYHTEMDTRAKFLETNSLQLELKFDNLNTERASIEDVDMADAITELVWAQTCYSAALQVGMSVIPQSLIDYMS